MYLLKRAQIAYFKADKAFIEASSKYADFADFSSLKLATKFFQYTNINNHAIMSVDDQQSLYGLI